MNMFYFQCSETAGGKGCTIKGVCGKEPDVAKLQDLLVWILKGASYWAVKGRLLGVKDEKTDHSIAEGLFTTITNVNFDPEDIERMIRKAIKIRDEMHDQVNKKLGKKQVEKDVPEAAVWNVEGGIDVLELKGAEVGVLSTKDDDIRSLRELMTYGIKGIAAYTDHAYILRKTNDKIFKFIEEGLAATLDDSKSVDDLIGLVMKTGEIAVKAMALLDEANTSKYGNPEITEVNIGVRDNPGILISGHDLVDLERLLEQTKGTGVDVYTHSEMLPGHYYPAFKKYDNFVGNYGGSWWKQITEFETFNGPILFTTNCIVPPKSDEVKSRIYTTGAAGFPGCEHIMPDEEGKKDFSKIIEQAKTLGAPKEIETGKIVGGFAHNQVVELADKVVDAVKSGAIKKFFVMAGCDGRMKSREYYTQFAEQLPKDTVILTAGCAKYRYNKLPLGDIGGIPRVLDAGQCNDSYSLAVIAMKLKEVFELNDINELPIAYNIAWYEQKAVIVLLALLYLGVKNIHLGPTLPAFLSPNVAHVLVEKFGISGIGEPKEDVEMFMAEYVVHL